MSTPVFYLCLCLIASACGCIPMDRVYYTAQPLSITIEDRDSYLPVSRAQISVAPALTADGQIVHAENYLDCAKYCDQYSMEWDSRATEHNRGIADADGRVSLVVNIGMIMTPSLNEALGDRLTGRTYFLNINASGDSEVIQIRVISGQMYCGTRFRVSINSIGTPEYVHSRRRQRLGNI